ncbi:MAG: Ig-like domain-containing protein [Gemmatimonadetes bacterium]|nr:Ig-like domain-containing protein [Gemmatimonadota bacterium]
MRSRRRAGRASALLLVLGLTGCLSDDLTAPASIEKDAATDQQSKPAGSRMPLRVIVRTVDGSPAARAVVRWSILTEPAPGGSLSDEETVTDGTGFAQVQLRTGPGLGSSTVRATLVAAPERAVVFTVESTRSPILTQVTPAMFQAGDNVVLSGENLDIATSFEVAGVTVAPIAVAGSGLEATLSVPPCLVPGVVEFHALAGSAVSDPVTGQYTASAGTVALAVGEYLSLSPEALAGCATFAAAGPSGAEYLIAPQSTTEVPGDSAPYRLRGSAASPPGHRRPSPDRGRVPYALQFDRRLREVEREIAGLPRVEVVGPAAAAAAVSVGDQRTFQVCADLNCRAVQDFATVLADAKYVGDHAIIYQDVDAPAAGIPDADFAEIGQLFDQELYDVATRAFGAESDVDKDGRVAILLTPVVNSLTPTSSCETSFIAGFFFALDINPGSIGDSRSNQAEVFYAIVPDPQGEFTCDFSVDQVRTRVPVTFIHEFQHMISFHQHVMLRNGFPEEVWLNEALSHLSEEIGAFHFLALTDTARFSTFAVGNLINAYDYLLEPGDVFTLFSAGTGTLEERGAGWLFLRWAVDQFGDDIVRRMSETSLAGGPNVATAIGEDLPRLLSQWWLANWVSDLPDSVLADADTPARLKYDTWRFRTTFGGFNMQSPGRFPRPFPLVPEVFTAPLFDRERVIRAGSGDYFRVVQLANDPGFVVSFTQPSGATLSDAAPRLNVIRIR